MKMAFSKEQQSDLAYPKVGFYLPKSRDKIIGD